MGDRLKFGQGQQGGGLTIANGGQQGNWGRRVLPPALGWFWVRLASENFGPSQDCHPPFLLASESSGGLLICAPTEDLYLMVPSLASQPSPTCWSSFPLGLEDFKLEVLPDSKRQERKMQE